MCACVRVGPACAHPQRVLNNGVSCRRAARGKRPRTNAQRGAAAAAADGVSGFTSHTDVLYASSGHIYTDINDWCRQRVCAESDVECLFVRSDL